MKNQLEELRMALGLEITPKFSKIVLKKDLLKLAAEVNRKYEYKEVDAAVQKFCKENGYQCEGRKGAFEMSESKEIIKLNNKTIKYKFGKWSQYILTKTKTNGIY